MTIRKIIDGVKNVNLAIESGRIKIGSVKTPMLLSMAKLCNEQYRSGDQIVDDHFYDHVLCAELRNRGVTDDFLNVPEPEPELIEGKTATLPHRMLSTDKAYDVEEINKWVDKVVASARSLGFHESEVKFSVTPKLDGFAGTRKGANLYTRGDGYKGTDISRVLARGVKASSDENGPGELVVNKAYFDSNLSDSYENSRNFMSSVIKESAWGDDVTKAVREGAVVFQLFADLRDAHTYRSDDLRNNFMEIRNSAIQSPFDVDGIVIECANGNVKDHMGHTSHHHRWQIAFKENTEFKDIVVLDVTWQTGKTGVITPVAELEPTRVSGATISRVTCHNAGNLIENGIGKGATVRIYRSGLVIPYIERVIKECVLTETPLKCPSCGSHTEFSSCRTHLSCTNHVDCPAQIEGVIEYWFKTLGNCDGFGPSVISNLSSYGAGNVCMIYRLEQENFENAGLGAGTSANLLKELERSKSEQIDDWRFLAAFSIHNVGKGGCEKLLKHHRLEDVFSLTIEDVVLIDGFAEKTASILVETLARIKPDFDYLYGLGFNLSATPLLKDAVSIADSSISGKVVVFTGSMKRGNRDDMKKQAKGMGATVGGSVTGKTDYLICGDRVGQSKISAAEKKGVTVISEDQYFELIAA